MYISSQNFSNNNSNILVNNPPNITNYPFFEYMQDNKQNFDKVEIKNAKALQEKENRQDKYMTGLLWATILACGVGIYMGRNKLKKIFKSIKNKFHEKQESLPTPDTQPPRPPIKRRKGFWKRVKKTSQSIWRSTVNRFTNTCVWVNGVLSRLI